MPYHLDWESPAGLYVRFTGWVTPESASKLAHAITGDPRYDDLHYIIVDLTESPGHTFRRNDPARIGEAMVQLIGAGFSNAAVQEVAIATDSRMLNYLSTYSSLTPRPFKVFATLPEAREWLARQAPSYLRTSVDRPSS
jgi:hypothetical protein